MARRTRATASGLKGSAGTGSAMPLTVRLHPGIEPGIGAAEALPLLVGPCLGRSAADGREVIAVDMHVHAVVLRFGIGVGVLADMRDLLGLIPVFALGANAVVIARQKTFDNTGAAVFLELSRSPLIFH